MTSRKVIIFGPTGAVGSATARTAAELGARVVLAMRDTEKAIPGLAAKKEEEGRFERVYADLTKPDTVHDAVSGTGAKHAFLYLANGTPDHMKSTIDALKSAGIELVVFLSSFTVRGDLEAIEPSQVIPYLHAQVEIRLKDVFGDQFVAVRPGSFAKNSAQYKKGIQAGEMEIYAPGSQVDAIVTEDIGAVCGTILAKGPQDEERVIFLYGPELMSQADYVRTIAEMLNKTVEIKPASKQEGLERLIEDRGWPEPLARYMVDQVGKKLEGDLHMFGYPVTEGQLSNVEKYSGRKATTFKEWLKENKEAFTS